ncbi:hypothetical protein UA08_00054 [Talaromyces atroroseus]|uniref:F-box domain-containing protein n=1 Tax=Talaromyces atroroseus TaxID=1441469 RepID=A0A225BC25_TALAT|nr:hypothetical protein UA08_00054 [Talaromyces atroroseus]OKL63607.1 hypothetical protein UA08_00054 [Talaromyces atroroseus]
MDLETQGHENDDYIASRGTRERLLEDHGAFHRLPSNVIQKILYIVDANTFASLTVLNQQWRKTSNNPELYAHHLSRCPMFSVSHGAIAASIQSYELDQLKQMFAREVRKNAFQLFLRPHITLVTLISSSVGSSAALPTGEALKFDFSANGQILLCLSSSRIFVLDLAAPEITVLHQLKTSRMPLAATILDDGRLLAVVSHRHQVNIYHLSKSEAKHVQVLTLNDVPRALALAPSGSVLGIAYDGSIEVHALGENDIATQCRAVRCGKIDALSFSLDGSMLLGSSLDHPEGGFVTITAPFPTDSMMDVSNYEAHTWTTQILFPDVVSGYSHVTLVSSQVGGDDDWIIGFDSDLQTFRAVRPSDPKTGSTFFPGPASSDGVEEYVPSLSPAINSNGELVALAFRGSGLWLYGLPDDFSLTPLESNAEVGIHNTRLLTPSTQSPRTDYDDTVATRLRQSVNQPLLMIEGRKVADIPGLTAARWVSRRRSAQSNISSPQRLVAVAPGGVTSATLGDETIPVDGGRISIFDFQSSAEDGGTVELTIELGEEEPLVLREPDANLEQEVELERRRTQMRRGGTGLPRADPGEPLNISRQSPPDTSNNPKGHSPSSSQALGTEVNDVTLFLDGPYSNTAPRSRETLQRAATAAAANRRSQYSIREHERPRLPALHIPHESDADNWVPPPPPYTRDAEEPLPERLRQQLLPPMTAPPGGAMDEIPQQMVRANTNQENRPDRDSSVGGAGVLSRRWSTRRRTVDTANDSTSRRGINFRPLSFHRSQRVSTSNSELGIDSVPPLPPAENDMIPPSTAPRQTVRPSPTDSGTAPSSGIPRRPFRNSRLFGNIRRPGNDSAASQSSEQQQQQQQQHEQYLPNPSPRRNRSVMRNGRFSRSSPNLAIGSGSGVNRMSTIYSNASRSVEQNRQVRRTRSRSEVTQPPAPLTEEALRNALQFQNANDRRYSRIQTQLMPIHGDDHVDELQQQQGQSADADWQQPNPAEFEAWRARIEAWNANTINERKRSRSKTGRCIVM